MSDSRAQAIDDFAQILKETHVSPDAPPIPSKPFKVRLHSLPDSAAPYTVVGVALDGRWLRADHNRSASVPGQPATHLVRLMYPNSKYKIILDELPLAVNQVWKGRSFGAHMIVKNLFTDDHGSWVTFMDRDKGGSISMLTREVSDFRDRYYYDYVSEA